MNLHPVTTTPSASKLAQALRRLSGLAVLLVLSLAPTAYAEKLAEFQKEQQFPAEAPADRALIYFYRPHVIVGTNPIFLFVDEQFVGITRGNTYMFAMVEPGEHILWAKSFNTTAIKLDVVAGETYYVQIREAAGLLTKSRAKLRLANAAKASARVQRSTYMLPTEAGEKKGAELASTLWQKAQKRAQRAN